MIADNEIKNQNCRQLLASFFTKYPNARLKIEADRTLKRLMAQKVPMLGKPGGWVGGIIYGTDWPVVYRAFSTRNVRNSSTSQWKLSTDGLR